jgi:hypothetical protein
MRCAQKRRDNDCIMQDVLCRLSIAASLTRDENEAVGEKR